MESYKTTPDASTSSSNQALSFIADHSDLIVGYLKSVAEKSLHIGELASQGGGRLFTDAKEIPINNELKQFFLSDILTTELKAKTAEWTPIVTIGNIFKTEKSIIEYFFAPIVFQPAWKAFWSEQKKIIIDHVKKKNPNLSQNDKTLTILITEESNKAFSFIANSFVFKIISSGIYKASFENLERINILKLINNNFNTPNKAITDQEDIVKKIITSAFIDLVKNVASYIADHPDEQYGKKPVHLKTQDEVRETINHTFDLIRGSLNFNAVEAKEDLLQEKIANLFEEGLTEEKIATANQVPVKKLSTKRLNWVKTTIAEHVLTDIYELFFANQSGEPQIANSLLNTVKKLTPFISAAKKEELKPLIELRQLKANLSGNNLSSIKEENVGPSTRITRTLSNPNATESNDSEGKKLTFTTSVKKILNPLYPGNKSTLYGLSSQMKKEEVSENHKPKMKT